MTNERKNQIYNNAMWRLEQAQGILSGDKDNYDGADGARYIKELAAHVLELLDAFDADNN